MSLECSSNDFLDQFRSISHKLKKRFLRKPNVTEACDAFSSLGVQCEMNEMSSYAGLCWTAAARCEGSLGNAPSEVNCLLRAARSFIKSEIKDKNIGCPSQANEHLQANIMLTLTMLSATGSMSVYMLNSMLHFILNDAAALSCYSYAGSRCLENSPLASGINLEIAENLKVKFDRNENVEQYLKLAAAHSSNCLDTKLNCLGLLASSFIESRDFTSALVVFTEMSVILEGIPVTGVRTDLLLRCEYSRIFLLLILRPTPQRLAMPLARLLEKYLWNSAASDPSMRVQGMSDHIYLLLQSLVMACQSQDTASLPDIEAELWPHLSTELRGLLRILVRQYNI